MFSVSSLIYLYLFMRNALNLLSAKNAKNKNWSINSEKEALMCGEGVYFEVAGPVSGRETSPLSVTHPAPDTASMVIPGPRHWRGGGIQQGWK